MIFLLLPLSAAATVTCKNFTWKYPTDFTYVPGSTYVPMTPFFMEFSVECSRTGVGDGTELRFILRPQNRPTPKATLGSAKLGFGYSSRNDCQVSSATFTPSGGWGGSVGSTWSVAGVANFQLFESLNTTTQRNGLNVCIDPTPVWPIPAGLYTSSDTWEYQGWNSSGSQVWPNTAGTWAPVPGSQPVNITVPSHCVVNLSSTLMTISYMPFSATSVPATPTVQASVQCNTDYQLALSPMTATAAGIEYNMKLTNSSGVDVAPSATVVGTGSVQSYNINASAIAGQAGDCTGGCLGVNYHELLVTFN
jgi:hypothetical protein